jgi:RNA polymerase sigma factor (sigma-70 family)
MSETRVKDTFTGAFLDYYPLVYSVIYSKVGSEEDAEDICQEVFLILYDNMEKVQNVRKWLYGTLRNLVLQHFQKKSGGHVNVDEIFDDVSISYVNGFRDTRIIINEAVEHIEKDETDALLLDLISVYNYSYTEAASICGLSKRQVAYRYNQAVKRIFNYLAEKGIKDIGELL